MGLFGKKNKGSAPESKLKVSVNKDGDTYTVLVDGRLDTLTSPQLDEEINKIIGDAKKLIFDLDKLAYISSAGLRVLLGAAQQMDGKGEMVLIHVSEAIREIFDVTGFIQIFNIE
jgi:anti-sigma B factor antagonist